MKIRILKLIIIMTLTGVLFGCGGGGGSSNPEPPPPVDTSSSDWDAMVWDQDDWG